MRIHKVSEIVCDCCSRRVTGITLPKGWFSVTVSDPNVKGTPVTYDVCLRCYYEMGLPLHHTVPYQRTGRIISTKSIVKKVRQLLQEEQ